MTELLHNPPDSARLELRRAVVLYRERRNHPNWLSDEWSESEAVVPVHRSPRYIDQLLAYAALLLGRELHKAGHSLLSLDNLQLATVAGAQLLVSELTEAEQATIQQC